MSRLGRGFPNRPHTGTILASAAPSSASGSLTLAGAVNAAAPGTAAGSLTLGGAASAGPQVTGSLSLGSSASAKAVGTATGSLTLGGSASAPVYVSAEQNNYPTTIEFIAKTLSATAVRVGTSTNSGMTSPTMHGSATAPDGNSRNQMTATGLTAQTKYYWQLFNTVGGVESAFGPIQTTRTMPASSGVVAVWKETLISCTTQAATDTGPTYTALLAEDADWNNELGDYGYWDESSGTTSVWVGRYDTQNGAVTGLKAFDANQPSKRLRSDHDGTAADNGDPADPGASASIAAHQTVFPNSDLADVRSPKKGLYYAYTVGRVRYIVIDAETVDRSLSTNTDNSSKTYLGATQDTWFATELARSEPCKVVTLHAAWGGTDTAPPVKGDWVAAYTTWRSTINALPGWNSVLMVRFGDTHSIAYATPAKAAAAGGAGEWWFCGSPTGNTGGGRNLSLFTASFNNSLGRANQYLTFDWTDDGSTIACTVKGKDVANSVTQFTVTPTMVASGANGSLTLGGSASAKAAGTATGSLTLGGSATAKAAATAAGSVTLGGAVNGVQPAAGSITLGGSANAAAPATAAGSIILAATATAAAPASAITGSVVLSGTATGNATGANTATGSISLTATATGAAPASGTGLVTLGGAVNAAAPATAAGSITLGGTGSGAGRATATATVTLVGTANAAAPLTATASIIFGGSVNARAPGTATGSITLVGGVQLVAVVLPITVTGSTTALITVTQG